MASLRHEHTAARREALQLLYTSELTGAPLSGLVGGDEQELLLVPECPQGVSDADLVGVDLVDYASTLVDGIVDLVETGNTLRENGLVAIEDVMQVSARLIVNVVSMKLKKDEINTLIDKIERLKEEEA